MQNLNFIKTSVPELGFKLGVEIFRAISCEKSFIEIRDFMIYLKTHANLELGFVLLKYSF